MASSRYNDVRHVLLSGPPGIGKTTLIQKICRALGSHNIPVQGFVTEEVRQGIHRVGFDVVTMDGIRGPLARQGEDREPGTHCYKREYRVGKYSVEIDTLEQIAVPALNTESLILRPVYIVDEIGKMESYSPNFISTVRDLFNIPETTILATVPIAKGRPIHLVEELTKRKDTTLFYVSRENREPLVNSVANVLMNARERLAGSIPIMDSIGGMNSIDEVPAAETEEEAVELQVIAETHPDS